jgi:hypothetical protein
LTKEFKKFLKEKISLDQFLLYTTWNPENIKEIPPNKL